jgi:TonB-dependent receptor
MTMNNITTKASRRELALRRSLSISAAVAALIVGSLAYAQDESGLETVVVTGYRASLEKSLDVKRDAAEMVDAISAEDVGKFPDSNLAESLQRLPGVAVDRDNGEGRSITVRGLGSNFTRVTLNGLEALSTVGGSSAQSQPNRNRGFDFNTFASELFSNLKVRKSASASAQEGSLGATIELSTPRPFDYGDKIIFSAQNAWYENGKPFNPRISGLISENFMGGRLGVLISAAYTLRNQFIDGYSRSAGQSDFTYSGSDFKWDSKTKDPNLVNGFDNVKGGLLNRAGFAAPIGTPCNGAVAPYYTGVIPGNNITYGPYCAALSGSDPATYALINSPQGWTTTDNNPKVGSVSSVVTAPGSTVVIPALPSLGHQQLYQQRIGLTGAVQWQADDDTKFTLDALFSTAYQDSTNYTLSVTGLNRNNTNTALNTGNASSAFTTCTPQTGSATQADVKCYSAKNQDPFSYYTNPLYGYNPNGSDALAAAISRIGRPSTKLIDAKVAPGALYNAATYLKLDNIDYGATADQAYYTTQFTQLSLKGEHRFSNRFRASAIVGWEHSNNHQTGLLAGVNRMDSSYAQTGQYFVFDATQGGEMPAINFGFDVANPANWTSVKNYSAMRHFEDYTDNKYRTLMTEASYDLTDQFTIELGVGLRIFDFNTSHYMRAMKDVINPSFLEGGVTTGQMTQLINWGSGLDAPSGTPTRFVAPNLKAYEATFGFNCNCINDYGDWRLTNLFNPASTGTAGDTFNVSEHSKSYYGQVDFHEIVIFGNELRGNVGARFVTTEIKSLGHGFQGDVLSAHSSYNDFLPSINIAYSLGDDMLVRLAGAKVMARPSLEYMAPSITSMKIPTDPGATVGATMEIGNPKLKPYRGKTFDIGWEWYFDKGAVLAVSGFVKWISSNPQVVVSSGKTSEFLTSDQVSAVTAYYQRLCQAAGDPTCATTAMANNLNTIAYLENDGAINATLPLNGPGGVLQGLEITYQQHLDFIPAFLGGDGFGVNANYTKIHSKQHYIINSTTSGNVMGDGPWNGASPDAWNFTLYYDGNQWSARVSSAFRSGYLSVFPLAGGSDVLGYGNSPLVNDFGYSKNTLNLDMSATYDITDWAEITLDALNLTNQPDRRWAYVSTPQTTKYSSTGRQVFLGFRLKY